MIIVHFLCAVNFRTSPKINRSILGTMSVCFAGFRSAPAGGCSGSGAALQHLDPVSSSGPVFMTEISCSQKLNSKFQ